MKRLLLTTALGAVPFLSAPAFADCLPDNPGDGDPVLCASDDADGFSDGSKNITLTVNSGVTVFSEPGEDAIKMRDEGNTVINNGTIDGDDEAIVGGDGLIVENYGDILSGDNGIIGETEDEVEIDGEDERIVSEDMVIHNHAGATIVAGDDAIQGGAGLTVTNDGAITAADHAINAQDVYGDPVADVTVTNTAGATITATGGDAVKGGDNLSLTNHGTIHAGDEILQADGASGVVVTNTGVMTSGDKGITTDDGIGTELYNDGTIQTVDESFEAGDDAIVVNTGLIEADEDDAINVGENALITNSGTIRNLTNAQDAIDLDSGTIVNEATGVIVSNSDAAIDFDESAVTSTITNHGEISGTTGILVEKDPNEGANTAVQHILNHGLIEGRDGLAIDVGAGDDILEMYEGAILIGGIDMGEGEDQLDLFGTEFGLIAGGSVLDGGADFDTVSFDEYLFGDIAAVSIDAGGVIDLTLDNGTDMAQLSLLSWESFAFADTTVSYDRIAAIAAVPLPAGILLLGGALAGLGLTRRRKG